eukprot:CAMPEP_0118723956 /NCGR_PEP_ID=MMETSP0800-20121206/32287_1 /TAXON_ID=210618 ORGANISM="Striatella unipunctata, Strain CCMP2910" /NCGR_SAMPLE_ID=MMETSP0800 /ASSEMBLY_ACC=CAM_ASM_000638 /LENGTH=258 /DNA_ID=CAMNT_0006632431 /DNA_START=1 /DNA_END=777 /DNA_ORIENTATION=+
MIFARPGGFWEFYAGLGVAVLGSMPSSALYFGIYAYGKRKLRPFGHVLSDRMIVMCAVAISAAIGNTLASFSRVPYEVLKQRLQTGQYRSLLHAFQSCVNSERGFLREIFPLGGIRIQMIRDIPYAIFTLLSYELIRDAVMKHSDGTTTVWWKDMCMGGISGGIGSYLTNPMDVLKTRLQTQPHLYGGSVVACISQTWQEGGVSSFLRGSVSRLFHKVPANAMFFLFYEFFKLLLNVNEKDEDEEEATTTPSPQKKKS